MSWREHASCRDVDPKIMYGETGAAARQAIEICKQCPVRKECLTDARKAERFLPRSYIVTIRGGRRPGERWRMYRTEQRPYTHGTPYGYRRHNFEGTPACQACKDAERDNQRRKRQLRKEREAA